MQVEEFTLNGTNVTGVVFMAVEAEECWYPEIATYLLFYTQNRIVKLYHQYFDGIDIENNYGEIIGHSPSKVTVKILETISEYAIIPEFDKMIEDYISKNY